MKRAIIMPNLKPPVTTTEQALKYRERITAAMGSGSVFDPLMTLYLTDNTPPEEIDAAVKSGRVAAVKLYPAGATTNSDSGVTSIEKVMPTLKRMAELGLVLCVHGEVTDDDVDVFDREAEFIEQKLRPLVAALPDLRVVMEHITTAQAVAFVKEQGPNVAATITPQHLLYNRNEIFRGGVRPHMYCLPILKAEEHRRALCEAVKSGSSKFFLGSDSAPHEVRRKESSCGCAGIFTAPICLELYATAFETEGCLEHLRAFACEHGPRFYKMPLNGGEEEKGEATGGDGSKGKGDTEGGVVLRRVEWEVPASYTFEAGGSVVPLMAGEKLRWKAERTTG